MYIAYPLVISSDVADKIFAKYEITANVVEASVRTPSHCVRKGRGKDIYEILTRAPDGAYLLVVLAKIRGANYRLITARPMKPNERRHYESKRR